MSIEWRGHGLNEQGIDSASGKVVVRIDPRYSRPTEVDALLGDASRARAELGWRPEIDFASLVEEMVREDLALAERDALVADKGYRVFKYHD